MNHVRYSIKQNTHIKRLYVWSNKTILTFMFSLIYRLIADPVYTWTMSDPGIVCFQHCGSKIFCWSLPPICPACSTDLLGDRFELLPFRLPYPFVKPHQHPCSIILKPTTGDFLKLGSYSFGDVYNHKQTLIDCCCCCWNSDYFNSTDLHIGLTTSTGVIVEFDQRGLRKTFDKTAKCPWAQSLLVDGVPEAWMEHWDEILLSVSVCIIQ